MKIFFAFLLLLNPPIAMMGQQARRETFIAAMGQVYKTKSPLPFPAPGRIDFGISSQDLKLAEENEISLHVHAPGITEVVTQQVQYPPDDMTSRQRPQFPEGGGAKVPVLYHSDGSPYIKVIPRVLGRLVLRITARFSDAGYTKSEAIFNVRPPRRSPDRLLVGENGASNDPYVTVFFPPERRSFGLALGAFYGNVKERIDIDPAFASFEVRTTNNASVISFDKTTGTIKPLREGAVLVETTFGGWTNLTCVTVESDRSSGSNFNCRSLLRPGERVGMSIRKH